MRWTRIPDHEVAMRYGAAYWDQRAKERWDTDTHGAFGCPEAMLRAHRNLRQALESLGHIDGIPEVIELGCGFGASREVITDTIGNCVYVGVDCCTLYIDEARRRFPFGMWAVGDAMTWTPKVRAGLVVAVATVSSLESKLPQIIERIFAEWLVPGGQLLLAEENWFAVFGGPL